MDQHSATISELAGVEADLPDVGPMTERPHCYNYDPPPGALRTTAFHTV